MRATNRWLICLFTVLLSVLVLVGCDEIAGIINPHEHNVVLHEGKAATCTEVGWEDYETCSECDEYTTYKEIAALGHNYTENYQPDGDKHSIVCTRCGAVSESLAHDWQKIATTEPTCIEDGNEKYACTVCNVAKIERLEKLGHDFTGESLPNGDTHNTSCTRCTATAQNPHSWQVSKDATATCDDDGIEEYTCTDCGAEKSEVVKALGHDYSAGYQPDGETHSLVCSRCGHSQDSANHNWTVESVIIAPECMKSGMQMLICTECSVRKGEGISPLGHNYSENFEPNGDVHSQRCTRCTATVDSAHVWEMGDIIKAPECEVKGIQGYYCTDCKAEKTEPIDATGHISGEWVIKTPASALDSGLKALMCAYCPAELDYERIPADVESMPRLYFTGEYQNATNAKNEVDMTVSYINPNGDEFDSYATIKVQGSSSVAYDKKNYTLKLFKDEAHDSKNKVDLGWGKENKYVLKANWVDFSQARNVVSCRLWGDMVMSRPESASQKRLAALKTNGGAIDGFPIAVYMNGEFYGLYTLNVPKDEWMFGMGEKDADGNKPETEALIAADDWNSTDFWSTIEAFVEQSNGDIISTNGGWELRYCGTDDYSWVAESFNKLITFCQNNEGAAFKAGISQYLDVDAAIDYFIFMYANCMHDNASKNMLWATYDGKVWIPSVYDQDGTFGQYWDGIRFESPERFLPIVQSGKIDVNITYGPSGNNDPKFILWDRIANAFTKEILARYEQLRATTLSTENMIAQLQAFEDLIPESMFGVELSVWQSSRDYWWSVMKKQSGTWDYTKYHYDYMYQWVTERMNAYDIAMKEIYDFVY